MWRSQIPSSRAAPKPIQKTDDDDWETDPDFVNDVSEKEQRYGSKTVAGSGFAASENLSDLRQAVLQTDAEKKSDEYKKSARPGYGYGGSFGVEKDRMDKSAVGTDYKGTTEKHSSVKDNAVGYGGTYGVQKDRQDKAAVGWEHREKVDKHSSQKDAASGYGGTYGVHTDRQDRSAVGWDHKEQVEKHSSQKDATHGYGGSFGVQKDRQDRSAVGWDHREQVEKHSSQKDATHGYGGSFGVQKDRKDQVAVGWDHKEETEKHSSQRDYSRGFGGKYGVESDRQDSSAAGWEKSPEDSKTTAKAPVVLPTGEGVESKSESAKSIKARFENMGKSEQSAPVPTRPPPHRMNKTWQRPQAEEPPAPPVEESKVQDELSNGHTNGQQITENDQRHSNGYNAESPVGVDNQPEVDESVRQQQESLFAEEIPPEPSYIDNQVEDLGQRFSEKAAVDDEWATEPEPQAPVSYQNVGGWAAEPEPQDPSLYQNVPLQEEPPAPTSAEDNGPTAVAQFDYEPAAADELQLAAGALITNIQMVDEGWWYGTSNGSTGLFPSNYVELNQ